MKKVIQVTRKAKFHHETVVTSSFLVNDDLGFLAVLLDRSTS